MLDLREEFKNWLISADNKKYKTTILTASEYINRLNRLSQRLYNNEDWQKLSYDLYILKLLFMKNSHWIDIGTADLQKVVSYLYEYRRKNRNFNDRYNQYFHSVREQLDEPLSFSTKKPNFFLELLVNTEEYALLSKWIKHIFITEKCIKYLSWLYINKDEKRKVFVALVKYMHFLGQTNKIDKNLYCLLKKDILGKKRKDKTFCDIELVEASGISPRGFYSKYNEGIAEKYLSVNDAAYAIGCSETTVYRLLDAGKLHLKPGTKKIIAENVRRFLRRRHIPKSTEKISIKDKEQKHTNWISMKEAIEVSGLSSFQIHKKVKEGLIAYTRYGVRRFLYFKPDLEKFSKNK